MRSSLPSITTKRRPIASNERPSSSPVRPYPTSSRNGSRSRATVWVNCCSARACRNARLWNSASNEPIAYAQPITVR